MISSLKGAPSLTEALAAALRRPVDQATRRRARLHVLDWLACALAGARSDVGGILNEFARDGAAGPVHALGVGRRGLDAALTVNGGLGNVLEMDDVHRSAILHPGPIVIPAALAAAELTQATPAQFLDAIVRGYEATIRIGASLGTSHYRYWHNTATAGVFGAAAAAAFILGLDAGKLVSALGTAGSTSGGLWQLRHEPVMAKQWHNAQAALTGVRAALLAARGLTGPRYILEGPQGLFAATAPAADPGPLTADHAEWQIFAVSFKPWGACRHAHPAIDAALEARERIDLDRVTRIALATYQDALAFCDRADPTTTNEAKFSLQHAVAVTLLKGVPRLEDFEPAAVADPALAALRRRVTVGEDPAISARFPAHFGARLLIEQRDGPTIEVERIDTRGDPERPLSEDDLIAKAWELMAWGGIDAASADRLIAATLALADADELAAFTAALPGAMA